METLWTLRGTSPGVITMPPRSVPGLRGRATKKCPPCPVHVATWVSTPLALEADPQKRGLGTPMSQPGAARQLHQLSKNASTAHTALSGNFSQQERQVQPDGHVSSITPGGGRQDTTPTPRAASDLVCVLHFISVQIFLKN